MNIEENGKELKLRNLTILGFHRCYKTGSITPRY